MQIGAQLYTIREYTQTPEDIAKSLKKIADIGYKTIQVSAFGEIAPERLNEIAQANGLEIIVTHTNPDRILNDTENVIKEHKTFNCKHIGIGSMPGKYREEHGVAGFRSFIKEHNEVAKKISAAGLKLHYHNHGFEFERFGNEVPYDVMIAETDPMLWGFIVDTYWVQYSGRNPAKQFLDMKGRIDVCHFKDMQIIGNTQKMAAVMQGNLDFPAIIDVCNQTGIKYAMVEQDDCNGEDPFECLKTSYNNLKSFMSK